MSFGHRQVGQSNPSLTEGRGKKMSTGIGIVLGLTLLCGAIALGGSFRSFWDLEAIMITLGGTLAATLVSYPVARVINIFQLFVCLFREGNQGLLETTMPKLVAMGHKASEESVFSLEKESKTEEDRYVRLGLTMLIQGVPAPQIARRFMVEMECVRARHQEGIQLFSFMSRTAPSFGLLGTIIGLVNTLRAVGGDINPGALGPSMALALITTLYGCFFAFFLFLPASEKLKTYSSQEMAQIRMVRDAVLMIKDGRSGREIEDMLNAYLPPNKRQAVIERLLLAKARPAAGKQVKPS